MAAFSIERRFFVLFADGRRAEAIAFRRVPQTGDDWRDFQVDGRTLSFALAESLDGLEEIARGVYRCVDGGMVREDAVVAGPSEKGA